MQVEINNKNYKINIVKKNIKNMYLRVNENLEINITTNIFTSDRQVLNFVEKNASSVLKMIEKQKNKNEKNKDFYLLGKKYEIVICSMFKKPLIEDNKVFAATQKDIDKIYKDTSLKIFKERLEVSHKIIGNIPYPELRIRKMKRKWGYCNKKGNFITLNSELIKYGIDEIDYVIIHELCHLVHFNHSKSFWDMVRIYKPDYKKNKQILND